MPCSNSLISGATNAGAICAARSPINGRVAIAGLALALLFTIACGEDRLQGIEDETPDNIRQTNPNAPVAVLAPLAATEVPTPTTIHLDGTGSYDPDGNVVTWHWSVLSAPTGNFHEPSTTTPGSATFIAALAGGYTVSLIVEDDSGLFSNPAIVSFTATAAEDVHVELLWDYNANDMDLHLIRPGGAYGDLFNDCFYATCLPGRAFVDWGRQFDESDDPSLDIDNIRDTVPENINLDSPEGGEYRVVVNYYSDYGRGAATATVRIFVSGSLAGEFGPMRLPGSCYKWSVARISLPTGRVTEDGQTYLDFRDCI